MIQCCALKCIFLLIDNLLWHISTTSVQIIHHYFLLIIRCDWISFAVIKNLKFLNTRNKLFKIKCWCGLFAHCFWFPVNLQAILRSCMWIFLPQGHLPPPGAWCCPGSVPILSSVRCPEGWAVLSRGLRTEAVREPGWEGRVGEQAAGCFVFSPVQCTRVCLYVCTLVH